MSDESTVLVLGAGASSPYGFPTGAALKDTIGRSIRGAKTGIRSSDDLQIVPLLDQLGFTRPQQSEFAEAIARSPRYSIDAFLENQPRYLEIGRSAIAAALSLLERSSIVNSPSVEVSGDWYRYLYNRLGDSLDEIKSARLGIITFNYDRSFETYLEQAVSDDFGIPRVQARAAISGLKIIHVHGDTGTHEFGEEPHIGLLRNNRIRVMSEMAEVQDAFDPARQMLLCASQVCFLGFGYHPQNVKRLDIRDNWPPHSHGAQLELAPPPRKTVTGTTYGLTGADIIRVEKLFNGYPCH